MRTDKTILKHALRLPYKAATFIGMQVTRMKDPYDPSIKEIREWAYDKHSIIPVQDWDLIITDLEKAPLFMALSIENSSSLQDPTIQKWVSRSQELVKNPDLFDYDKWCNGEWIFVFWDD